LANSPELSRRTRQGPVLGTLAVGELSSALGACADATFVCP
jgi:hypothetical protein